MFEGAGPSRGAKIWGCTVIQRLYFEKILRDFYNLFFQKNWGCTCTPLDDRKVKICNVKKMFHCKFDKFKGKNTFLL